MLLALPFPYRYKINGCPRGYDRPEHWRTLIYSFTSPLMNGSSPSTAVPMRAGCLRETGSDGVNRMQLQPCVQPLGLIWIVVT